MLKRAILFGPCFGSFPAGLSAEDTVDELDRPVGDIAPLAIERDEMIAVVQNANLDKPAELPLKMHRVLDIALIVGARMENQRMQLDR